MRAVLVGAFVALSAAAGNEVGLDPLSGSLELARVDLRAGVGDEGYALRRTYVGDGRWHGSWETRLVLGAEPVWLDEAGAGHRFEPRDGGWASSLGAPLRLERDGAGYRLEGEGRSYRFDARGQLLERRTRGAVVALEREATRLTLRGPWGRLELSLGSDGAPREARLGARRVRYLREAGRLIAVEAEGRSERYAYDPRGRLTQVGETAVGYDAEGRVTGLRGGRVPLTARYEERGGERAVTVLEAGVRTRYRYRDGAHAWLRVERVGAAPLVLRYDERLRPTTLERGGELEAAWDYDAEGRLRLLHSPEGDLRLSYASGARRPVECVLPSGEALRWVYDEAGRVLAETSGAGTARYAYDPRGRLTASRDPQGRELRYQRDAAGYVVQVRAPEGVTEFARDADGALERVRYPGGREVRYRREGATLRVQDEEGTLRAGAYDAEGRLVAYQDELGRATRVDYDALGLVARASDKDGERFRCAYDAEGRLEAVIDAAGDAVRYARPTPETLVVEDPSAGRRELSYDAAGRVVRELRGGVELRYRYDRAGRLLARSTPRGEERFVYDRAGRLLEQAGPDGELRYRYDAAGRLVELEDRGLGRAIRYAYEGAAREPSEVRYPWGVARYTRDARGQLLAVELDGAQVLLERGPDGRRSRVRYPSGVETRYAYAGSRLAEVATWRGDTLLARRAYRYDARGRVAVVEDEAGAETRFTHDRRGRLLTAEGPAGTWRYAYDAAGNRTAVCVGDAARACVLAPGSRLVAQGELRLRYDARGALVEREGPDGRWRYEVDVDGRLRRARGPEGEDVRYGYAPDGTLLWREAGGERVDYLVDRQQVAGEFVDGALRWSALRGEGLDDVLLADLDGERVSFHRDLVGSVIALSDDEGALAARYAYGPFGEAAGAEGRLAAVNPWRFAGRPRDPHTGLYDLRARRYDAELGRFVAPDPSGRAGGLNLYAYADNDPTRFTDPLGLNPELGQRLGEAPPAPREGAFARALAAIERTGQRLPPQQRFHYNVLKGVVQAGRDTVVGVVDLFKPETWAGLYAFVRELDDWETVKAVGAQLLDMGLDLGQRYLDAARDDPAEFARMTGYGVAMVVGSVLGAKGADKLVQLARTAKAARLARLARAAQRLPDVPDVHVPEFPDLDQAIANLDRSLGLAERAPAPPRQGISQALDGDVPLGRGRPTPPTSEGYRALREVLERPLSDAAREGLEPRWAALERRAQRVPRRGQDARRARLAEERGRLSHTVEGYLGEEQGALAARNFAAADDLVRGWAEAGEPLTLERIQELNAAVGRDLIHNGRTPGVLRGPGENVSAGAPIKGYVPGDEVAGAMDEFLAWYRAAEQGGMPPVELAARAFQRLISVHPFADGNGRTARLVMDWVLQRHGLPPAAITDPNLAVFGAEQILRAGPPPVTPEQAIEVVTAGVERSLGILGAP
ncbi:MAG: RHS repeat-associated core domain-containing protein [Planctomycetota bacterium]